MNLVIPLFLSNFVLQLTINTMKRLLIVISLLLSVTMWAQKSSKPIRVSCIGNSITYGTGLQNPEKDSYPSQLQNLLGPQYEVGRFVLISTNKSSSTL